MERYGRYNKLGFFKFDSIHPEDLPKVIKIIETGDLTLKSYTKDFFNFALIPAFIFYPFFLGYWGIERFRFYLFLKKHPQYRI